MRKVLIVLSLAGFTLVQPLANAAVKQDAAAMEITKKIMNANGWKDVLGLLKNKVPNNLIKEMEVSTKDLPFPTVRKQKEGLLITDPNGNHLYMEIGKEGTIFFNGKEWKIRPLASAQSEIDRILDFLDSEKVKKTSWLDILLPSAYAGGRNGAGVAGLAQVSATVSAADGCDADQLAESQNENCTLMAAPMKVALAEPENLDPNLFLPVQLDCPKDPKNGLLTLISMNVLGEANRVKIFYDDGQIFRVNVSSAGKGESFVEFADINFSKEKDQAARKYGLKMASKGHFLLSSVCNGNEADRKRFLQALKSNKAKLASIPDAGSSLPADGGQSQDAL